MPPRSQTNTSLKAIARLLYQAIARCMILVWSLTVIGGGTTGLGLIPLDLVSDLESGSLIGVATQMPGAIADLETEAGSSVTASTPSVYTLRRPSSDGIGKVYMGREIAEVMGHRGAGWLERPSRRQEEHPWAVVDALDVKPTATLVDLGAGTGYFTLQLAPLVPEGKVLAVDVQPEMLEIVEFFKGDRHVDNVETILAEADDPNLPPGVDLVLMVDAYHEFEYPHEVMQAVVEALTPGGQVVLAEYRGENPLIPIKRLHKMTEKQVRKEMEAVGLRWIKTLETLPRQHLIFFEKPVS